MVGDEIARACAKATELQGDAPRWAIGPAEGLSVRGQAVVSEAQGPDEGLGVDPGYPGPESAVPRRPQGWEVTMLVLVTMTWTACQAAQPVAAGSGAASYVRPIDLPRLSRRLEALPAEERQRVRLYMEAARRDVLQPTDGCFPDRGPHEHWRNLAERAKGAAVLSSCPGYWPEELRLRCRQQAQEWVREVVDEFGRHPNFGLEWQAAFWASEAGIAAWFLWNELPAELRDRVATMVAYQADRFVGVTPQMAYRGDTQAETVSWNSSILTLAVNMMPGHPHRAAWDAAAKVYLYNTFAAPQDADDVSIGDDGTAVNEWVAGANVYRDFALENHGQFHVDYIFACFRYHAQGLALYWLTGTPTPKAFHHHVRHMYEKVMLHCMDHDRFFAYVSDNDWARYHNWTESCVLHGYIGLMEHDDLAYSLEGQAIRNATRLWRSFPEGFHYANEYVCGKAWTSRIADAVLLHVACELPRPRALGPDETDARLEGTSRLRSADLLTQTSAGGSLRSYARGQGAAWVAFVAPRADPWLVLPLQSNYGVSVGGKRLLAGGRVRSGKGRDWFWVVRHSVEGGAAEALVSLPEDAVLFMERSSAASLGGATAVENAVAVERPHCATTIRYAGGRATYTPGDEAWLPHGAPDDPGGASWVNVQSRFGVVCAVADGHAALEVALPEPGVRSAIRFQQAVAPGRDRCAAMVLCPDQGHRGTRKLAGSIDLVEANGITYCRFGPWVVAANLRPSAANVSMSGPGPYELPPWTVTARQGGHRRF